MSEKLVNSTDSVPLPENPKRGFIFAIIKGVVHSLIHTSTGDGLGLVPHMHIEMAYLCFIQSYYRVLRLQGIAELLWSAHTYLVMYFSPLQNLLLQFITRYFR